LLFFLFINFKLRSLTLNYCYCPLRFEEILAECEEDDELETNVNQKPKAKLERGRKKKSAENYLHESEDDILDFTEANSNRKILSKFNLLYLVIITLRSSHSFETMLFYFNIMFLPTIPISSASH